jgi:indolepyruvate ferredoxin oxidoreductase
MRAAMKPLAKLKFLRGTPFDPFGRSEERRMERALIADYEKTVETLLAGLRADNLAAAAEIARLPESIRGFGPIKQRNAAAAQAKQAELLERYGQSPQDAAHAVAA